MTKQMTIVMIGSLRVKTYFVGTHWNCLIDECGRAVVSALVSGAGEVPGSIPIGGEI